MLKKFWNELIAFISDVEDPEEPIYDPLHFGGMIVGVIFTIGVLFWLFWTLLVYGGGIFVKIIPALQVLFTKKTLQDFGWVGYPYELGVFEGFIANLIALLFFISLVIGIWKIFEKLQKQKSLRPPSHTPSLPTNRDGSAPLEGE